MSSAKSLVFMLGIVLVMSTYLYAQGGSPVVRLDVDDFSLSQPPLRLEDLDGTFPLRVGVVTEGEVLGGERDTLLILDDVDNPGDGATLEVKDGRVVFHQNDSSRGRGLLIYDGKDGDAVRTVASNGLNGGMDLTQGGRLDGLDLAIVRNDLPLKIGLVLFTGTENNSEQILDIPVVATPTTFRMPFSDFIDNGGVGADLIRVTTALFVLGTLESARGPVHLEIDLIQINASTEPEPDDTIGIDDPLITDVLVDQIHDMPSSGNWSVDFPGDNPWDAEAADDFEVPAGESWNVTGLDWAAEWRPEPPADPTVNVTIYANDQRVPGGVLFRQTEVPIAPVDHSLLIWHVMLPESVPLGEGTYWCSVQANVPIGTEMLIKENSVGSGSLYTWRNPGGGFDTFCSQWEDGISCGGNQPSLALRLLGEVDTPCSGPDVLITDVHYTPPFPRAGEPFTVEVTVENQGCAPSGDVYIDWFANLAGPPLIELMGDRYQSVALAPGDSHTLVDTFLFSASDCYSTYARVSSGPEGVVSDFVHGPTSLCVAAADPLVFWFNVQEFENGDLVTDDREVTFYDEAGQGIPIADTQQPAVVRVFADRYLIVDGTTLRIFDRNGRQIGAPITTQHVPRVLFSGDRIVIVDGRTVTIYDKDGHRIAVALTTTNPPVVVTAGNRIIVVDGKEIGIYDRDGHQIGGKITTTHPAQIFADGDRFLVVDGNVITLYDQNNNRIGAPITTTNAAQIYTTGDRFVVVDGNEIKLYDRSANQQGASITTRNRPAVSTTGNRIVVVDGTAIRLFDKNGIQIGARIVTTNPPDIRTAGDRIVVIDGNEIKLYDESANQIGASITTANPPRLDTAGDRILVIENNQIRIFDKQGSQLGGAIPTTNPPVIRTTNDRIFIIDGNELNIYDTNGNRVSGPHPLKTRTARLMPAEFEFAPGQQERFVWLPLTGIG
jgi:protein required for attachment to host cells